MAAIERWPDFRSNAALRICKHQLNLLGGDWLSGGGGERGWLGGSAGTVKKVGVEPNFDGEQGRREVLILALRSLCSLSSFTRNESSTIYQRNGTRNEVWRMPMAYIYNNKVSDTAIQFYLGKRNLRT